MSTNPIPSTTAEDFEINVQCFDRFINSTGQTYTDRLGQSKLTVKGLSELGVYMPAQMTIKTIAGTTYSLILVDALSYIRFTSSSAVSCTVPLNADVNFGIGHQINIVQAGAGQVTLSGDVGVTINTSETRTTRKQGSLVTLVKVGTDEWDLIGDTEAA